MDRIGGFHMSLVEYVDRRNTSCMKWDILGDKFGREDLLAMWVADMDFKSPRCVADRIREYVDFGVFGYYMAPQAYFDAFMNWEKTHHGYEVKQEWIRFAPGVVPAFNWFVRCLTDEGDGVLIMPPVYYPFKDAIVNNKRKLVECPLLLTEAGYKMDPVNFEKKILEEDVKAFIFCSPHNPVGRVWKPEETKAILDICKKHHVYVISDEIHQDIIMTGYKHVPSALTGEYDDILVTLTAASKTFNLAGLQNSIVIIPNEEIREKYDTHKTGVRINGGNIFGYLGTQAAYEEGGEWLAEVLTIIEGNYHYVKESLEAALPDVYVSDLEGTYLMWIDLGKYIPADKIEDVIINKCGLAVDFGSWFGKEGYDGFIRINLATRRENMEIAVSRIIDVLKEA